MEKIKVTLNAFYGYSCMGRGHSSEQDIEVEVNEQEFEALRKLDAEEISSEVVAEAIEKGDTTLQPLHEKLEEEFYYMVEEYWLYEADNECLYECLEKHIEQDINDGLYTPTTSKDKYDCFDCHCWGEEDDDEDEDGCEDEEDGEDGEDEDYDDYDDEDEESYDLDEYYDWVKEHDHVFVAERVGLDLEACREDEVNYTITFSE